MAYIGNAPAEAYTNTVKDTFSGNGSTVAFTLSRPSLTNDVRVVVENVIQDPTVAYSVSGTTLTFTSAPPAGTNNIYVVHLGPAVQTVQPPSELNGNYAVTGTLTMNAGAVTNNFVVDTNTLFVDATNNRVGIGTVSPSDKVTILGGGIGVEGSTSGFTGGEVRLGSSASGSQNAISTTSTGTPEMYFDHRGTSTGSWVWRSLSSERMRLDASGHLIVPAGVTLGTAAGVYNAANTLDDYEEGTFTATLDFASSTGSLSYTYNTFRYIKIGDMVFVSGYLFWNANNFSASSGSVRLEGLPFAAASAQSYRGGLSITYSSSPWTGVGTIYQQAFRVEAGETFMVFNYMASPNGDMGATVGSYTNLDSAGEIMVSGSYTIA